ncbi:DUF4123 domain-containing protein [Ningiella sp. W23]|uniref:DUF4123 domain-containing protein n=1 Tax=Ningiella sp. W23 TaxID=3023715 RepID=UPI003757F6D9
MEEFGRAYPDANALSLVKLNITPLDEQKGVPFWEAQWISPELKDVLFGQASKASFSRTYCILDPTLRQKVIGYFDLDMSSNEIPVRCLVKGKDGPEFKEAAPFLIDMTLSYEALEDDQCVPHFHKDFFKNHWGHSTGIFIRTTVAMDDVWKHFRRFLKIQIEADKKWVFFRFWDPRILPSYFDSIKAMPHKVAQWIDMRNGNSLDSVICEHEDAAQVWQFFPELSEIEDIKPPAMPTLCKEEMLGIEQYRIYRYQQRALNFFHEQFPELARLSTNEQLSEAIRLAYQNAKQRGLASEKHHFKYLTIVAFWGSGFERDPMYQSALRDVRWDEQEFTNFSSVFSKIDERAELRSEDLSQPKRILLGFERLYSQPLEVISHETVSVVLQSVWPAQFDYLALEDIYQFVVEAADFAQKKYKLTGSDLVTYIVLAMYFGFEFGQDPLYPWASEALNLKNPEKRRHLLGEGVANFFKSYGRLT